KLGASATSEHGAGALLAAATVAIRPGQTLTFPEYDAPSAPGGGVRGQDGASAARMFLRFETGDWSVAALAGRREKEIPNAPFGLVFADPSAEWIDNLALLTLGWNPRQQGDEGWYAQIGMGRYEYEDLGRYEPDDQLVSYSNVGVWAN